MPKGRMTPYGLESNLPLQFPTSSFETLVSSPNSVSKLENLFPVPITPAGAEKREIVLRSTPGTEEYIRLPGNDYVYRVLAYQDHLLALTDSGLYRVTPSVGGPRYETLISRNLLPDCRIAVSSNTIMVCSGGSLYEWTEERGTLVRTVGDDNYRPADYSSTLPDIEDISIVDVVSINGYFIVGTSSHLLAIDSTLKWTNSWFLVNDRLRSGLKALVPNNNQLWVFGERKMEVWLPFASDVSIASANAYPFIPDTSTSWEVGVKSVRTIVNYQNLSFFVADNGLVYSGDDRTNLSVIGDLNISEVIRRTDEDDISAYAYTEAGQVFYCLVFPESTWCYEIASGAWHQRKSSRLPKSKKGHIVGDMTQLRGTLYAANRTEPSILLSSIELYRDVDSPIVREVVMPTIEVPNRYLSFWEFSVGVDVVNGSGDVSTGLSFSDDAGRTFSNDILVEYRSTGVYNRRPRFLRLGRSRARIFKLRIYVDGAIELGKPTARVTI